MNTPAAQARSTSPPLAIPRLLAGQKALVTGANSGIGRAVAVALGEAGADVAVNYVTNEAAAEEVVAAIRSHDVDACACRADVACEEQVARMFQEAIERFGTLDILVNNAGLQRDSPFAAVWLACDLSDYVVGTTLFVDGGMTLYPGFATGG